MTLIGRSVASDPGGFVLEVGDVAIRVASIAPPPPGTRVAVEGSLLTKDGQVMVAAQELDVLFDHMV